MLARELGIGKASVILPIDAEKCVGRAAAAIHTTGSWDGGSRTPLELAIRNQTDRFSSAVDAIDQIARKEKSSPPSMGPGGEEDGS